MKEKNIICPYCKTETSALEKTCVKCKNRIPASLRNKTLEEIKKETNEEQKDEEPKIVETIKEETSEEKENHKFKFGKKQTNPKKENSVDKLLAANIKKEDIFEVKEETDKQEESKEKLENITKEEPEIDKPPVQTEEPKIEKNAESLKPQESKKDSLKDTIEIPAYEPDYFTKERIVSIVEEHYEENANEEDEEGAETESKKLSFDIENVRPELDIDENTSTKEEYEESEPASLEDSLDDDSYEFEYIDELGDVEDDEENTSSLEEIEQPDDYMHLEEKNVDNDDGYIGYEDLEKTIVIPNIEENYKNEKFTDVDVLSIPMYFFKSFINPYEKYKSEEEQLDKIKNVGIITAVIIAVMTILRLLNIMLNTVRITSFWTGETSWAWKNLSDVKYLSVIGEGLLIYSGIILGISITYFILNIILKKKQHFVKILSVVVTSFIPFGITYGLIAPLLSMIYLPIGIAIVIIGFIYSVLTLIELINYVLDIENASSRIFFHMLCLSIVFVTLGLIIYQMVICTMGV